MLDVSNISGSTTESSLRAMKTRTKHVTKISRTVKKIVPNHLQANQNTPLHSYQSYITFNTHYSPCYFTKRSPNPV